MYLLSMGNSDDRIKVERLYCKYRSYMYRVAYHILQDKYLAEDAVQQSFIRVINNLQKIDEGDCYKTKGFLLIICRNISYDIYNQNKNFELNFYEETENTYTDTIDQTIDSYIIYQCNTFFCT